MRKFNTTLAAVLAALALGSVAAASDRFSEEIVGGLGPVATNSDRFAEAVVGGLGPVKGADRYSEAVVGGLGPRVNTVATR